MARARDDPPGFSIIVLGKRTRTPRRRGPKGSNSLTYLQVKELTDAAHRLQSAGAPLNRFVTIRSPTSIVGATDQKRAIRKQIDRLRERFEYRGEPFVAVVVYEAGASVGVHAHVFLHAPPRRVVDIMRDLRDSPDCHVRDADAKGPLYVSKQRRTIGDPKDEKSAEARLVARGYLRTKGGYVPGNRLYISPAARALLAAAPIIIKAAPAALPPLAEPAHAQPVPAPVEIGRPACLPVQLGLPLDDAPPVDPIAVPPGVLPDEVRASVEGWRRARGLTHDEIAAQIGLSRPQVTNVIRGRFGIGAEAARRLEALLRAA